MKTRVLLLISGTQTLRRRVVPEIHKDISKRWKDQVIRKGTRIKQTFKIKKMKFDRIKGRNREVYSITGDFITYPFLINWLLISSHPWLKDLFWALSWIFITCLFVLYDPDSSKCCYFCISFCYSINFLYVWFWNLFSLYSIFYGFLPILTHILFILVFLKISLLYYCIFAFIVFDGFISEDFPLEVLP